MVFEGGYLRTTLMHKGWLLSPPKNNKGNSYPLVLTLLVKLIIDLSKLLTFKKYIDTLSDSIFIKKQK
jgi:hypothetical protein